MAGLNSNTPQPTAITVHQHSRTLEIAFADGKQFRISFELMRIYSPSAEVQGHGPGQEVLQTGKRDVGLTGLQPVGSLRGSAQFLRRPRQRHLLVGLPLLPRIAAGRTVAAIRAALEAGRRGP